MEKCDGSPENRELSILLHGYNVAAGEAARAKNALLARANFILLLNGGFVGLLSVLRGEEIALGLVAFLGIAFNVFWMMINQRNRSYIRYWHDHLISLEEQINRLAGFDQPHGLRTYSLLPKFAHAKPVPIISSDELTQIRCSGRMSIERSFTWLATFAALAWLAILPLVACGVILTAAATA